VSRREISFVARAAVSAIVVSARRDGLVLIAW